MWNYSDFYNQCEHRCPWLFVVRTRMKVGNDHIKRHEKKHGVRTLYTGNSFNLNNTRLIKTLSRDRKLIKVSAILSH